MIAPQFLITASNGKSELLHHPLGTPRQRHPKEKEVSNVDRGYLKIADTIAATEHRRGMTQEKNR